MNMTDRDCVQFLKWSLPRLRMRWNGFRRVRGQVCRRVDRRLRELGLADANAYRALLEQNRDEWKALDSACRVSISRFYRDRDVFRSLEREVLVRLSEAVAAQRGTELRCWSIGCASGEEPYTLALLWDFCAGSRFPEMNISIIATDADRDLIERGKQGCYAQGSLRNLPPDWRMSFLREDDRFCIRDGAREKVAFFEQDIRIAEPEGMFHLILCRNIVFTYFDTDLQREILMRLRAKLHDQGALVIGAHESLPPDHAGFAPWPECPCVYFIRKHEYREYL